jgi:hypothetical protein
MSYFVYFQLFLSVEMQKERGGGGESRNTASKESDRR